MFEQVLNWLDITENLLSLFRFL